MKIKLKNFFKTFLLLTNLVVIYFFALSCQKQSAPGLAPEEVKGSSELERLDACSRVNFNKGVLLYTNALDLFVCNKWNEQFPYMFESMKKVSSASWDHLIGPIDEAFVSDHQRRDKAFKNIRELDSKGGLDDLSYVMAALNETNFFDSTKAMFTCVDNPSDPVCDSRQGRIPEKRSLKNIIKLVDLSPDSIDKITRFLKLFVKAIDGHQEELRTEINKFRSSALYVPTRLALVDAISEKIKKGFSDEDREFVSKLLLTGNETGEAPWIYDWIQSVKMNRDKFRDLLEYPALVNPDLVAEFRGIKQAYDDNFSCTIKNSNLPNDLIELDLKYQLYSYGNIVRNDSQKKFFDVSTQNLVGLKLSSEICKELEVNKYHVNLTTALVHFAKFLGEKTSYDLIKFIVNQTTLKADPNKTFSENIYFADFVAGNVFNSVNNLNTNIVNSTRDFLPLVFDIVKSLPSESYVDLGEFLTEVGKVENDPKYKGLADFWTFFSPEEKNFVFNFLDRHFDNHTNYVMLFDFYTKFLDDLRDTEPLFKDRLMGTDEKEEMSYLSIQDFFSKFAGKDTLLDFKKFFSRDQILKVLEVISNGQQINQAAKYELARIYSDNYVIQAKTERYKFKINYKSNSDIEYDSKALVDCMQKFTDVQNGIYQLIRNLPTECTTVTNENIAIRMYGWLNAIENSYLTFKKPDNQQNSLFDQVGILSPYMLNSSIALSKIIDNLVGPLNSNIPTENGLSYLLSSFNFYLNEKAGAQIVEKNLQWTNTFFNIIPEKNILHRNSLVKSLSKDENFSYGKTIFDNLGKLSMDYGDWIKSGEYLKAKNRSLGTFDPSQTCEKTINQFVSPYACPSKEIVKKYGNEILFSLQNIWEKDQGSPIAMILKGMKMGEGLDVPLNGKSTKKIRLTLRDNFKQLYDMSDKNFPVNNTKVNFTNEFDKTSTENVTTLERVESVVREVRFVNNYLGVAFLNTVVHGNDYNKDVMGRKKLLNTCIKIPVMRCGRPMSKSDHRMALNALSVYDGLLDANNGRGLDNRLQYGDALKTFQQTLIASSAKAAQKVQLLPLKDEVLAKHNGKVLSNLTLLTAFSNGARVIRDRVGRTRAEFESFIEREDFKRVDRALLNGFDLMTSSAAAERILNKFIAVPTGSSQNLFGNTVDWITTLSYDETRLLEDTLARVMVVGSYLGTPEIVFNKPVASPLSEKYKNNNLYQILLAFDKVVEYWPTLKTVFPADVKLIEVIKPLNTALYFFTAKLNSINDPQKNYAYLALNDLFLVLQTTMFENMADPRIGVPPTNTTQGLDFLIGMFKDSKMVADTYGLIRSDYRYTDTFYQDNGLWFSTFGQNLRRVANSSQIDLTPFRDFLAFSSKDVVCLAGGSKCTSNYHFDEPASLVKYLNKKNDSGQSYFMVMNQKLFVENSDQLSTMLEDLMPVLKIKEVKPPLSFN